MAQQKKKKGGFFSGLGSAVDGLASSIDKAAKDVSSDVANITLNPLDHLHHGNIISISSKCNMKSLVVDAQGVVRCTGHPNQINNRSGQFEVVSSQYSAAAIKLRNMAYPNFYLAIVNGYFIGNGQGGPECDFYGRRVSDSTSSVNLSEFCAFESAMTPGSHIGVLQTGQFTAPAQTSPQGSNYALFRVKFIKHNKPPPPPPPQVQPQGSPQLVAHPGGPPPGTGYGAPPPGAGYPPPPQQQQQQQGYPGPPPQYNNPPPGSSPQPPPHEKQGYPPPSAPPSQR